MCWEISLYDRANEERKCDKNISIYMLQILDCFDLTTYIKNAFQYLQYLKINF